MEWLKCSMKNLVMIIEKNTFQNNKSNIFNFEKNKLEIHMYYPINFLLSNIKSWTSYTEVLREIFLKHWTWLLKNSLLLRKYSQFKILNPLKQIFYENFTIKI